MALNQRFTRGRAAARRLGIAVCLALLLSSPALADLWYEYYERAEAAMSRGDWAEAVSQLQAALEEKGDSSHQARTYGMNFVDYFPYYKMGIAYFNLGQMDAAAQAFDIEEQLGAIAKSADALADLQQYRDRIAGERAAAAENEKAKIEQLVQDNLGEAKRLENAGDLQGALGAVDRALAVAQDHAGALAVQQRLRQAVAAQAQEAQLRQRIDTLVGEGRSLLASNRFGEAASTFDRALALRDDAAIRQLRDQAQTRLRAELEAQQTAEQQRAMITGSLEKASRLESAGSFAGALEELQSVLVLEPRNSRALQMKERLLRAQGEKEAADASRQALSDHLAKAEKNFNDGRFTETLASANLALAVDPGNAKALQWIRRGYGKLNEAMLNKGPGVNFPPIIQFVGAFRTPVVVDPAHPDEVADVEVVEDPAFRLGGMVVYATPVDVVIYDSAEREVFRKEDDGTSSTSDTGFHITEFAFKQDLYPGSTTFRVVASANGTSRESEYIVRYDRPFYRSPWLYWGVAAAAALAGAGLYGRRAMRMRQLRKRRFNPYIAGAPVIEENLFYGRERLLDYVLQRIHQNSILLYGERRIGKTSLQHHLKKRLKNLDDPKYKFYAVYSDLQGTPEARFFATLAEDVFHELAPILDGIQPDPAVHDDSGYGYRTFIRDLQKVMKALKKTSEKQVKLVLLIDEVDELNSYDPRTNQKLRSLFMKSFAENLVTVVSGVGIKKTWEREGSPWYNFFQEVEVKPFRTEDAEELIQRPIQGVFTLENGVVKRIISVTDCKPYLIQKLCTALVSRLYEEGRKQITLADVEALSQSREA